jgi:metal-responsive CopG/Arc/MetJ family transcriptional regulator
MTTEDLAKVHVMQIRMPKALWTEFQRVCALDKARPSEIVREMVRATCRERRELLAALDQSEQHFKDRIASSAEGGN